MAPPTSHKTTRRQREVTLLKQQQRKPKLLSGVGWREQCLPWSPWEDRPAILFIRSMVALVAHGRPEVTHVATLGGQVPHGALTGHSTHHVAIGLCVRPTVTMLTQARRQRRVHLYSQPQPTHYHHCITQNNNIPHGCGVYVEPRRTPGIQPTPTTEPPHDR